MHALAALTLVLLHGSVVRAPTYVPAAHVTLVFVRTGGGVTRVRTDAKGRYSVRLKTGLYTIRVPRIVPGGLWLTQPMGLDFMIRR